MTDDPVTVGRGALRREEIENALTVVIQSWGRCRICGDENNDAHDSVPHGYEACDYTALFLDELHGVGLEIVPAALARLEAPLREQIEKLDWWCPNLSNIKWLNREHVLQIISRAEAAPSVDAETINCELELRKEWWLNHGHDGVYGDDGEMQCGKCLPIGDYLRTPIVELYEHVHKVRLARLAQAINELTGGTPGPSSAPVPGQE